MTTTSSLQTIKSNLSTSSSVHNMSTNGNDYKSSRICIKRPLSTASFIQNNSTTNGFTNQLRKRTLQINNLLNSKIKSNEQSTSPPRVFHAIAPASSDEVNNNVSKQTSEEQKIISQLEEPEKSNGELKSPTSRRLAHVLAHSKIKAMSTDPQLMEDESSCSNDEDDEGSLQFYPITSSMDADADESDNGNNSKFNKCRRFQKTRKTSNSSITQKSENNHEQQHSSSNDEENREINSLLNGNNERRSKVLSSRKSARSITTTTTTTTTDDENAIKQIHLYHPLDNLESKLPPPVLPPLTITTNESNLSSPNTTVTISTTQPTVKKVNRFQVKSIRKSQQQILLANNAAATKSSNDDDCSVPNENSNLQLKPSIIERTHTATPTTDVENSTIHIDNNIINGTNGNLVENGHHRVRFHVTPYEKKESVAEESKLSNQTRTATVTTTVTLQTPAQPSSTASAQGEDDEEEEAVGKSPDGRFIKYAKEIGRGAFKTVYRGLDTETSVAVAWCELQDFAQFDKHERARFKEEAEMLKKLQHPNIVRFYDFWEETNPRTNKKVIILVTELMTSGSLKGYIRKFKGQKEEKRINVMKKWCRQILKGLAYLHSRNPPVIHRDLKCDNVFISSTTGCVKIGDLGLATFKTQTFAKSMRGTMEFMAPEMFDEKYDELVDIYSFGLCMLEMITGEYPYIECKGPTAVIKRVTAGLKPDCYYKVEGEDVREVIDCCIRTKKEERLPVNELLQHSFFLDDNGLRVEFVRDQANDLQVLVANNSIDLKLKIIDKTKRKALWTEHEAIRFRYNFTTDTPEQIADELIQKKYIFEDDKKFVVQSIKDRLRAYQYEQIDRKAGVFCREGKPSITQSTHISQQQQQQVPPPQPPSQQQQQQSTPTPTATTPLLAQPQLAPVRPHTPTPTIIQQAPIEVPQQPIVKLAAEVPQVKPVVQTEPIPIGTLSDLSSSVSGSAGSLEILDAALKKTFNKNNISQSTTTISTITNDNNETLTSLGNHDDSSASKLENEITHTDQQQKEESTGIVNEELTTNLFSTSTSVPLQTQSQPTTMLNSHQAQILQNPLLLSQTSQSFSYSTAPPSQHLINTTSTNDSTKPLVASSSSTATTETIENSLIPISPSPLNETNQTSMTSDTNITTTPPILGSLKQLDALLKNTFKNSNKTSAGTAHNSDTETANPTVSLTINDESDFDETKRKLIDRLNSANANSSSMVQSQPNTSSIILPKAIQQVKSQPTSQVSAQFDPYVSPEREIQELDTLLKTSHDKSLSNDDTITASSSNDIAELKLMVMDLSKNLLNRMNIIENKIDEHRNQTIQINTLLTKTILPSLVDLADIIHQTPNLDPRIRTKLENIQTNIRSSQQQIEMKDLMEI